VMKGVRLCQRETVRDCGSGPPAGLQVMEKRARQEMWQWAVVSMARMRVATTMIVTTA
jgi:hypothetical protein